MDSSSSTRAENAQFRIAALLRQMQIARPTVKNRRRHISGSCRRTQPGEQDGYGEAIQTNKQ